MSDLGFAAAATSKMAAQFAQNKREQVRCTFQSTWLLNSCISALVVIIALAVAFALLPSVSSLAGDRPVFLVLVIYSVFVMNARVWLGAFRATHNYVLGTLLYDGWLPLETLAAVSAAYLGGDLIASASVMLLMRFLSTLTMWLLLRRRLPWLSLDFRASSIKEVMELAPPALGALAIPVALALNLQGSLLLAGLAISPAAAATLGAVRTVSRAAIQVVAVVNRATMPELAAAWATKRTSVFRRLVAMNIGSLAVILLPAATVFAFFGRWIIQIWTHGAIDAGVSFIWLMAIALPIHGYWYFALSLLLASNQHTKVSLQLACLAGASLIPAFIMARLWGIDGIAATLLSFEIVAAIVVTLRFREAYYLSKKPDVAVTVT
ncbi:hypothetical protein IVB03_08490 [Bradyrhizobium sp. 168]|uniref:lipopolysaccharide biosynthesis protein n=1 Tax=unclassified Bradyrhizobium TaxID=2631580 RepID=UPI001FFB0AB8|nr:MULTISPECIES: hypothetical protein [unclassified Bradyrhizobium]MCK1579616.1 hypothetical protein [Bradyrhizobium sp. 168]UPK20966.1 hypothetical protein IVA73_08580 [Bradyrhizobium sp. 131]